MTVPGSPLDDDALYARGAATLHACREAIGRGCRGPADRPPRGLGASGVPAGCLAGVAPEPFHLLLARVNGEIVGTALGFDRAGDCGVFNVSTLEHVRRRGLGTALTARLLHDAAARGCRTASLQATP